MSPSGVIPLFKPYELEHHARDNTTCHTVQEYVYYCESRFRSIVAAILRAPPPRVHRMQLALREELFVILGYIGTITAIGRVVDIPIFIRSLAGSLIMFTEEQLPARFESAFVEVMEAGARSGYGHVVPSYLYQWWSTPDKKVGLSDLLAWNIMPACVDYHVEQLAKQGGSNLPTINIVPNPQLPRVVRPIPSGAIFRQLEEQGADSSSVTHDLGGASSTSFSAEVRAAQAQNISSLSTTQLKAMLNRVNGYRRTYEAQTQYSERRALGFHVLMERVMEKEMTTTGKSSVPKKNRGAVAEQLRSKSEQLFAKQKDAMPTESQWTFGEVLTKEDVMELGKEEDQASELPTGPLMGEWSARDTEAERSHISVGVADQCSTQAQQQPPPNVVQSRADILLHTGQARLKDPSDFDYRRAYVLEHQEEAINMNNNIVRSDVMTRSTKEQDQQDRLLTCDVADIFSDEEEDTGGANLLTCDITDLFSDGDSDNNPREQSPNGGAAVNPQNCAVEDLFSDVSGSEDSNEFNLQTCAVENMFSDVSSSGQSKKVNLASCAVEDMFSDGSFADDESTGAALNLENCSVADMFSSNEDSDNENNGSDINLEECSVAAIFSDVSTSNGSTSDVQDHSHVAGPPHSAPLYTSKDFDDIPQALFEESPNEFGTDGMETD